MITSLSVLPEKFTEESLYLSIAGTLNSLLSSILIVIVVGLSYTGDFRMTVGEDKNKVANIVRPQLQRFRDLYKDALSEFQDNLHINGQGDFTQNMDPAVRRQYISR